MPPQEGFYVVAPARTRRFELGDRLPVTHNRKVLAAVLDRVQEIGEVPDGFRRRDLAHMSQTVVLDAASGDGCSVTQCSLYYQVDDVAVLHRELAERGVEFLHEPQRNDWGYGAELLDPDGRLVGLWDEQSMQHPPE